MADVTGLLKTLESKARRAHSEATQQIAAELDRKVPVDTGALRANRLTVSAGSSSVLSSTISYTLPQGEWTDKGTKAHGPTHAPFLVFRPKGSAKVIYTKWVKGIKPRRWFSKTMTQPNWSRMLRSSFR